MKRDVPGPESGTMHVINVLIKSTGNLTSCLRCSLTRFYRSLYITKEKSTEETHKDPQLLLFVRYRGNFRSFLLSSPDRAVRAVLKDNAELLQLIARSIGCLPVLA